MKFIYSLGTQTLKYFKGLFAIGLIWIAAGLGIFIFDSCQKNKYDNSRSGEAARKFNELLESTRPTLGSIAFGNNNSIQSRLEDSTSTYYVDFPSGTNTEVINNFSSNVTIQSLRNVLEINGVSIADSINNDAEVIISVSEEPIRAALQPLVIESRNYLLSKGATNQQIDEMLLEESAEEIDLILFVKALTTIEQSQYAVRKINFPLVNEANARNAFLECGLYALGGDALYALSQSTASAWTWATMKSAFKTVAKKFLGPIGVAVAVVSFGICMLG